jgi:hypothetical protein
MRNIMYANTNLTIKPLVRYLLADAFGRDANPFANPLIWFGAPDPIIKPSGR